MFIPAVLKQKLYFKVNFLLPKSNVCMKNNEANEGEKGNK